MTGASTRWTLLSSIKTSLALSHNSFTSCSVMISPLLSCSSCLYVNKVNTTCSSASLSLFYLSKSPIFNLYMLIFKRVRESGKKKERKEKRKDRKDLVIGSMKQMWINQWKLSMMKSLLWLHSLLVFSNTNTLSLYKSNWKTGL